MIRTAGISERPPALTFVTNTRGSYQYRPDPRGKHLSDVFTAALTRLHAEGLHSHEKPIDWITCLIGNCTRGLIFDPFTGSGSTIIAAERLARIACGIEIDPRYIAVILERCKDAGLAPQLAKG